MNITKRVIAALLCSVLMLSSFGAAAAAENNDTALADEVLDEVIANNGSATDIAMKTAYNALSLITNWLVGLICSFYPDPVDWKDIDEFDASVYTNGSDEYQTAVADGAYWSLGYSSNSIIPDDFAPGKYNIGRDLNNRYANYVYDDQRTRAVALDDNSGNGITVFCAIDTLGVTSTDAITIRQGVLDYAAEHNLNIAAVNVTATHSHSALDTQGVATSSVYKIFANGIANLASPFFGNDILPGLDAASYFKAYFIEKSIYTIVEALNTMEKGSLSYTTIDDSEYVMDKRGLIDAQDIPEIVSIYFEPDDTTKDSTYIIDISCHPTSFSASNLAVSSDYIYYLDNYLRENANANMILMQGALGQLSRQNIEADTTELTEEEAKGAETKALGEIFGKMIADVDTDTYTPLDPIINTKSTQIFVSPTNYILLLACKSRLVNNAVYRTGEGTTDVCMPTELNYVEFGGKMAFAMFPVELYPEVFWGNEIIDYASWDGSSWDYPAVPTMINGIDLYCVSLANDALGYVVCDNYWAFMGHIIGDEVADETLSIGKNTASQMINSFAVIANEVNAARADVIE